MAKPFKMICPRCRWREYEPMKADECVSCETDRRQLAAELKREREREAQMALRKQPNSVLAPVPHCGRCLTTLNLRDVDPKTKRGICASCKARQAPKRLSLANSYSAPATKHTDLNRIY